MNLDDVVMSLQGELLGHGLQCQADCAERLLAVCLNDYYVVMIYINDDMIVEWSELKQDGEERMNVYVSDTEKFELTNPTELTVFVNYLKENAH